MAMVMQPILKFLNPPIVSLELAKLGTVVLAF